MSKGDLHTFHFSPSGLPDLADLEKSRALMRADWKIVTDVDIPYCAGNDVDGTTVYIDKDVPEFAEIAGRRVNIWDHVFDHEAQEKTILLRYGNEHYAGAHTMATYWEDACVRAEGLSPKAYEQWWAPIIRKIGSRKVYERVPADLDLTPYEDSHDDLLIQRMRFVKV